MPRTPLWRSAVTIGLLLAGCTASGDELPGRLSGGGGIAEDTDEPRGTEGDAPSPGGSGTTSGTTSGADATSDGETDPGTTGVDLCAYTMPTPCNTRDGLDVFCLRPGEFIEVRAGVEYEPGWPEGLPAMGLGAPMLGYIPVSVPLTCEVTGCENAIGDGNSGGSMGKICEANFDSQVEATTVGRAKYLLRVDPDAPVGDYPFGYTTNTGATVLHPDFWIRITT